MRRCVVVISTSAAIVMLLGSVSLHPPQGNFSGHLNKTESTSEDASGSTGDQSPCPCLNHEGSAPECCSWYGNGGTFSGNKDSKSYSSSAVPTMAERKSGVTGREDTRNGENSQGRLLVESSDAQTHFQAEIKQDKERFINQQNTKSAQSAGPHLYHGCRRDHRLTDTERNALHDTLLLIEELKRFPNSSRVRAKRQALPPPECDPQPLYRTTDGTCNNPNHPLRGAAGQGCTRLAAATYQDGVFLPRFLDSVGRALPGPRRVSRTVVTARDVLVTQLTDSVMQWGQFLDHDLALSPEIKPQESCCRSGRLAGGASPFCLPIRVDSDDPVYSECRLTCMEFVRSVPAWEPRLQVMTQLNTRTSYIDADMIYGVGNDWMSSLRSPHGRSGLKIHGNQFLLPDFHPDRECFSGLQSEPCFLSGDHRVNVQTRLTVMHTIWMREHNRVARGLEKLNPHWDGDRLFEESRRIVIAEVQHITYKEWLPVILGVDFTRVYMIEIGDQEDGYSTRYNADTEPAIATEFSTAAFRFGHSLINDNIYLYSNTRAGPFGFTLLKDMFFNPHLIYQGALDMLAKSLVVQSPQKCDANFASVLTGHLFQKPGDKCGLDLIALNIQRGRDHGLPTYTQMRRWCGLPVVKSFSQLTLYIPPDVVIRLAGVYNTVDDIDLFVGGVSERTAVGAVVGPTFQCIIGNQFFRLRWGDNFFYDLGGTERPWRFTATQLMQLRHTSWSRILCDNVPTMSWVQPRAFLSPGEGNPLTPCGDLPKVDLSPWETAS